MKSGLSSGFRMRGLKFVGLWLKRVYIQNMDQGSIRVLDFEFQVLTQFARLRFMVLAARYGYRIDIRF